MIGKILKSGITGTGIRKDALLRIVAAVTFASVLTSCSGAMYKPGDALAKSRQEWGNEGGKADARGSGGLDGIPETGTLVRKDGIRLAYSILRGKTEDHPVMRTSTSVAAPATRPVLLLHGGPGMPFPDPAKVVEASRSGRSFLYWDQRGCGASTRPFDRSGSRNHYRNMVALEHALGMAAQITDMEAMRRMSGAEKIDLVGHSFGAFCAALYAAEFPERVGSLVLVCPAECLRLPQKNGGGLFALDPLLDGNTRNEYALWKKKLFDFGHAFDHDEAWWSSVNEGFAPFYAAAYERKNGIGLPEGAVSAPGAAAGFGMLAPYFSMGSRHDWTSSMRKVLARTLVVTGNKDLADEGETRETYGMIPGAEFVRLDSGHFPWLEAPEAFGAALDRGLAGDREK